MKWRCGDKVDNQFGVDSASVALHDILNLVAHLSAQSKLIDDVR